MSRFDEISTAEQLINYLKSSRRLENSSYLYHYTKLENALLIIKNRRWHLSSALHMNDLLEYKNGDPARWKNIFSVSYMGENRESIGMWSMYSQPWENGVKIAIPKSVMLKWVKGIRKAYEVDARTQKENGRVILLKEGQIFCSAVAYCNTDSRELNTEEELTTWSTVHNKILKNVANIPELTGYVKNEAWSYEKEIRLRVEFENSNGFSKIAVEIPEEVIDSIIITAGPLFEGNLKDKIQETIQRNIAVDNSLFANRFKMKTICESCDYKIASLQYLCI
ncbi:MAG: hypothetical protein CVU84_03890 [Firmicutes bacterium HGW-Firmicutes-1]|nr:MAG: hypothetical protein CVU84_03890 [Firmicutes bacterium HGW-Firmicutes-1]